MHQHKPRFHSLRALGLRPGGWAWASQLDEEGCTASSPPSPHTMVTQVSEWGHPGAASSRRPTADTLAQRPSQDRLSLASWPICSRARKKYLLFLVVSVSVCVRECVFGDLLHGNRWLIHHNSDTLHPRNTDLSLLLHFSYRLPHLGFHFLLGPLLSFNLHAHGCCWLYSLQSEGKLS